MRIKSIIQHRNWAKEVVFKQALRRDGRLTPALFASLTGIHQTIDAPMTPSGSIKVKINATVEKVTSTIETIVSKKETTDQPFIIFQWRR